MTPLLSMMLAAALSGGAPPAGKPDFTGLWKMDVARSESPAQETTTAALVMEIVQTDASLQVETDRGGEQQLTRYPIQAEPVAPAELTGQRRAFWDGGKLISEGAVDIQGKTVAFREVRTPQAGGNEMVVETTVKVEHGYQLPGVQTVVRGKNTFVRAR